VGNSISDLEKMVHEDIPVHIPDQIVMEDALIGTVKKLHRSSSEPKYRLYLAVLGAVASLLSAPITYIVTFVASHTTNAVTVRLALLSPAIFLVLAMTIFGILWIMTKWFSLWFVMLVAGIVFIGSLIAIVVT
jgi:hypothetical protein